MPSHPLRQARTHLEAGRLDEANAWSLYDIALSLDRISDTILTDVDGADVIRINYRKD